MGATLVAASLALTGCSSSSAEPPAPSGPDLAAIQEAREVYGEPAAELATQARAVEAVVRIMRLEPDASGADGTPSPRRAAAVQAVSDEVAALRAAIAGADDVASDAEEPAVRAAAAAWGEAVAAATALADAAEAEARHVAQLLEAEEAMVRITAGWDEPGSRTQQRARFAELADEAQRLVSTLDDLPDLPSCLRHASARLAAALQVAERTAELKGFVDRGQGRGFDEARASYEDDPWHLGLVEADADGRACWAANSEVQRAREGIDRALDQLVEALNTGTGLPGS